MTHPIHQKKNRIDATRASKLINNIMMPIISNIQGGYTCLKRVSMVTTNRFFNGFFKWYSSINYPFVSGSVTNPIDLAPLRERTSDSVIREQNTSRSILLLLFLGSPITIFLTIMSVIISSIYSSIFLSLFLYMCKIRRMHI